MIFDSHVHIFPDKIAEKASMGIGNFYSIPMNYDGTIKTLLEIEEAAGVDRCLVHSVATKPEQVESINNFIADSCKAHPDKFVGFMAMHPDYPDIEGEIERSLAMGLLGIKIHPDFQLFALDEPRAMKMFEIAAGKLPVLIHTGDNRYRYSNPTNLIKVLDAFPNIDIIGAHFGGWSIWEDASEKLSGRRMWVDTSSSLYELGPERGYKLIQKYGAEQVLFGSDYPMWNAADELRIINQMPLTENERELILYKNAERLLGL
ncbi:MAG: amidohydrolase family protein [Ruminococcus sp.]|jgi:predicted TIM-barrel fold metal-dependent hydrolase|nr:amidohydrolase family protein [Ruminococcus sp.]